MQLNVLGHLTSTEYGKFWIKIDRTAFVVFLGIWNDSLLIFNVLCFLLTWKEFSATELKIMVLSNVVFFFLRWEYMSLNYNFCVFRYIYYQFTMTQAAVLCKFHISAELFQQSCIFVAFWYFHFNEYLALSMLVHWSEIQSL